jgi:hypothetical protein
VATKKRGNGNGHGNGEGAIGELHLQALLRIEQQLAAHGRLLESHGKLLESHEKLLAAQSRQLNALEDATIKGFSAVAAHLERLTTELRATNSRIDNILVGGMGA